MRRRAVPRFKRGIAPLACTGGFEAERGAPHNRLSPIGAPSMKRVLLSLLVVGGVLYAAHALFSADDVEPSAAQPAPTGTTVDQNGAQPAKIDDVKATGTAQALSAEALTPSPANSRHAIAVERAPSPAPAETSAGPEATSSQGANGEAPQQAAFMRVTSPASIREGPSTSAAIVGIAQPGAEAQIVARSSDWVEIIDPGSKKTGWIHQSYPGPDRVRIPAGLAAGG